MPTVWVTDWKCCSKHYQRNVTDPEGPTNCQNLLRWNLSFIIPLPYISQSSVSRVNFLYTIWRVDLSEIVLFDPCPFLSTENIPQINVSDSQSQTPSQLTFHVSKQRKADDRTTLKLRAQSIWHLRGDWKIGSNFLPGRGGDLESMTVQEGFIFQVKHRGTFKTGSAKERAFSVKVWC